MKKKLLAITIVLLTAAAAACGIYINDYYNAETEALECVAQPAGDVTVAEEDGKVIFVPDKVEGGMIFYPGGKVEYESYAPLMNACAERGILCVLVEMPANLAVLDMDAADGIIQQINEEYGEEHGEIDSWYMAGHSLGGSMAASYIAENQEDFAGLILLAAYSTADISDTDLEVLSIYGEKDKVLNMEKYEEYRINLPEDMNELIIEGGCHAYFGKYGMQDGDGEPEITQDQQIEITADAVASLIA